MSRIQPTLFRLPPDVAVVVSVVSVFPKY